MQQNLSSPLLSRNDLGDLFDYYVSRSAKRGGCHKVAKALSVCGYKHQSTKGMTLLYSLVECCSLLADHDCVEWIYRCYRSHLSEKTTRELMPLQWRRYLKVNIQ